MRISIDTAVDDFDSAIATVQAAYGYEELPDAAPLPAAAGESVSMPGGWTDEKLRKWAGYLRPDAQHVVRFLAAHQPKVPFSDAADHLGKVRGEVINGQTLGGAMSSGGHALTYISGVDEQPIIRDYAHRLYVIDPAVAAVLADELGPPASAK